MGRSHVSGLETRLRIPLASRFSSDYTSRTPPSADSSWRNRYTPDQDREDLIGIRLTEIEECGVSPARGGCMYARHYAANRCVFTNVFAGLRWCNRRRGEDGADENSEE